jgi:hypothetical protein
MILCMWKAFFEQQSSGRGHLLRQPSVVFVQRSHALLYKVTCVFPGTCSATMWSVQLNRGRYFPGGVWYCYLAQAIFRDSGFRKLEIVIVSQSGNRKSVPQDHSS